MFKIGGKIGIHFQMADVLLGDAPRDIFRIGPSRAPEVIEALNIYAVFLRNRPEVEFVEPPVEFSLWHPFHSKVARFELIHQIF